MKSKDQILLENIYSQMNNPTVSASTFCKVIKSAVEKFGQQEIIERIVNDFMVIFKMQDSKLSGSEFWRNCGLKDIPERATNKYDI